MNEGSPEGTSGIGASDGARVGVAGYDGGSTALLPSLPRTAWLAIDLDRLASNLLAIRRSLPEGVRVDAVVKSDAYGHGAVPVARALQAAGADGLCVATFDEAIELRDAGVTAPILVLFPIPPALAPEAAASGLAIVAGDTELLRRTLETLAAADASGRLRRPVTVHLEIETGLGRCGFGPDDIESAARSIQQSVGARWGGVWSHLAAPGNAGRTDEQASRFAVATHRLAAGRGPAETDPPARHLVASGGLLAASAPAWDRVRIGLSLYGLLPDGLAVATDRAELAAALRPVLSLRARPIRVTELPPGTGVSYGPSFVTSRPTRVATLPLGYGDGYLRDLSNRGEALVRGVRVPVIGTVAMDAVMLDVTEVPGGPVSVDDEFVLIGEQRAERIDVADLARLRNTISWEIVTSMSRRLPRVYYAAAETIGVRTLTGERGEWPRSSSGTATSATSRLTSS